MKSYQLTDKELDLIVAALIKLPYESVFLVISSLKQQYDAQLVPPNLAEHVEHHG